MAIVCLHPVIRIRPHVVHGKLQRTCRRPLSSRSPRSFTITISSMQRRTRSSGSWPSSFSSMVRECGGEGGSYWQDARIRGRALAAAICWATLGESGYARLA